jgi:diguanylate cyclase (GGDEF)-like protein
MSPSAGDVIVAIVPIDDLDRSSQRRTQVIAGGIVGLVLALILIGLVQARAIARPLENLVMVAGAIVRGEYRRVGPSRNHEVHALGRAVNHLASQVEHKLAELTHQATHDSLSGLANRPVLIAELDEALQANPAAGSVAILFVDLDNFKIVNDSLGHAAGDRLIVSITERLRTLFAAEPGVRATIARVGGDEFSILLRNAASPDSGRQVAERLAAALAAPLEIGRYQLVISCSIGVAYNAAGMTAEDLLRAADVAMYRAKAAGRGRHVVYDSAMGQDAADRLDRETELRQGLDDGAFEVYYQPIVDLTNGAVREVEAVVRWHHPRYGLVAPADFIPLAEETGLIVPLGRWVLKTACSQLRAWQLEYPFGPPLSVSVNLSARQLQQPGFVDELQHIVSAAGIAPKDLRLEITESCLMEQHEVDQLRTLAAFGVELVIDDFGTGYSSLARLSALPISTLKIDRGFVADLGREPRADAVVETIITLAHALHLTVTAEGIEEAAQAAHLTALGCSHGQGYLFGRPQPASALRFSGGRYANAA